MLKEVLVPELEKKFGAGSFRTGESPLVVFPAKHPDVGDVRIWDEGGEAVLVIGDITDSHFYPCGVDLPRDQIDRWVVDAVIQFLEALFSDKILLWKSPRAGGWTRPDFQSPVAEDSWVRDLRKDALYYVWSGPRERAR
jgi:hypothetical protein